jgi:two-component system sensor histidine kinase QseC
LRSAVEVRTPLAALRAQWEAMPLTGDRFFRPAGQAAPGSGLGVSIVRRVAELHGLTVRFADRAPPATGLRVEVTRKSNWTGPRPTLSPRTASFPRNLPSSG